MSAYGTKRTSRVQVVMSAIASDTQVVVAHFGNAISFSSYNLPRGASSPTPTGQRRSECCLRRNWPHSHTKVSANPPHSKDEVPNSAPPTDAVIVSHFQSADLRRNHALS